MEDLEYQNHLKALKTVLLEQKKSFKEQMNYLWDEIVSGCYGFERSETLAFQVLSVSKQEILDWMEETIIRERKSLAILIEQSHEPLVNQIKKNEQISEDIKTIRESLQTVK